MSDKFQVSFDSATVSVRARITNRREMDKVTAAIEAYRFLLPASADTLPEGQDGEAGLVRSKGSAVGEAETPGTSRD